MLSREYVPTEAILPSTKRVVELEPKDVRVRSRTRVRAVATPILDRSSARSR